MPRTVQLAPEVRQRIVDLIRTGTGRNAIARQLEVSTGVVSKIVREEELYFPNDWMTRESTQARQIDAWDARSKKAAELTQELIETDSRRVRRTSKLSRQIQNINRHTNGHYLA
jgi:hypothetical protein